MSISYPCIGERSFQKWIKNKLLGIVCITDIKLDHTEKYDTLWLIVLQFPSNYIHVYIHIQQQIIIICEMKRNDNKPEK